MSEAESTSGKHTRSSCHWGSVFALGLRLAGSARPWAASVPWWLLTASLGNITNIWLLAWLARREGFRLSRIFNFEWRTWKVDVPLLIAATLWPRRLAIFRTHCWLVRSSAVPAR